MLDEVPAIEAERADLADLRSSLTTAVLSGLELRSRGWDRTPWRGRSRPAGGHCTDARRWRCTPRPRRPGPPVASRLGDRRQVAALDGVTALQVAGSPGTRTTVSTSSVRHNAHVASVDGVRLHKVIRRVDR